MGLPKGSVCFSVAKIANKKALANCNLPELFCGHNGSISQFASGALVNNNANNYVVAGFHIQVKIMVNF